MIWLCLVRGGLKPSKGVQKVIARRERGRDPLHAVNGQTRGKTEKARIGSRQKDFCGTGISSRPPYRAEDLVLLP